MKYAPRTCQGVTRRHDMSKTLPPVASAAPPPLPIGRREALRRAVLLLGGTLAAPTIAGVLAGCDARAPEGESSDKALTAAQLAMVATIAEHIIPETDTPGARAAGVDRFIARMLAEYYDAAERQQFVAGLADVDARASAAHRAPFARCTPDQQRALLTAMDREAFARPPGKAPAKSPAIPSGPTRPAPDASRDTERGGAGTAVPAEPAAGARPFMRTMKELTVVGYYTSQAGATRELRHEPIPGRFDGCVPLAQIGRTWAV